MKPIFFVLAWTSFGLGVIGAFLPVLPTTPFLILSAFLFSKSSPRFHAWLLALPIAGPAITEWREQRVIRPKAKVLCAVMMLISLFSMWNYAKVHLALKVVVSFTLVAVGSYVLTRSNNLKS